MERLDSIVSDLKVISAAYYKIKDSNVQHSRAKNNRIADFYQAMKVAGFNSFKEKINDLHNHPDFIGCNGAYCGLRTMCFFYYPESKNAQEYDCKNNEDYLKPKL